MNAFAIFQSLLKRPRLLIGSVASVSGGTATITLLDGSTVQARGTATVGSKVFVRDGVIEGPAPNLTDYNIDV